MSAHLWTAKTRAGGARQVALLRQLARLYGVAPAYEDIQGRRQQPSPEGLLAVMRAWGAPLIGISDVPRALEDRRFALWARRVEPVAVGWDGGPINLELRLPRREADRVVHCALQFESGEVRNWSCDLRRVPTRAGPSRRRDRYVLKNVALPGQLPCGYHRLSIDLPGGPAEALIISAPAKAFEPASGSGSKGKPWGLFLPLYALWSERSWGSGDFSDLETLLRWTNELGGTAVAILPVLATFLTEPFDPSPYAPASRLFWNEFYLDVARVPEVAQCQSARALLASAEVQKEIADFRQSRLVDYRRGMALKRRILETVARCFFQSMMPDRPGSVQPEENRRDAFHRFLSAHPRAEDYARFRAACEHQHSAWPLWRAPLRDGRLQEGDYDERARQYHLYVQWLAQEQIERTSREARQKGTGLCLDLPLGFHPAGYDVWRWRETFVQGVSAGAPPDTFFTKGQVWSFPPFHPEALRQQGYAYFIECLRHQLKHASMLRIDHVMGFHRLFWIPEGVEASEGTYVHYQAEEFYAISSLESHRHKSWIVGENLGTVPPYVNPALALHNIKGMYVMQYELSPRRKLRPIPRDCVASLNTHDTPAFAGFWQGLDIEDQRELGLVSQAGAESGHKTRKQQRRALSRFLAAQGWLKDSAGSPKSVLRASLEFLSSSESCFVLVNLEDLWLETQPQNVPGTGVERPNWRRKASYSLETFCRIRDVISPLMKVNKLRENNHDGQLSRRSQLKKRAGR